MISFVHYEYLNPQEKEVTGYNPSDPRYGERIISGGINYYPLPTVVIKADYAHCMIGNNGYKYNSENTFSLSVGFTGWFFRK